MAAQRKRARLNPRFAALGLLLVFFLAGAAIWLSRPREPKLPGAGVVLPDYVTEDLLTPNEYSRPGTPLERIDGVVIHYVGNPATSAQANRNYFESLQAGTDGTRSGVYASAHFIVGLEGEVLACVPLTEWAYASNTRNEDTVSVEVCHPDESGEFSPASYDRTVALTAWLCHAFDLKTEDVIRHYDVSGKICPKYYVENEDAWAQFLADVDGALDALKQAAK